MLSLFAFFVFCLGLAIGSFVNVVALRYGGDQTVLGRSSCPSCATTLTWSELIPLASFLAQRGKCRTCRGFISWQYPLVELLTGLLFVGVFFQVMVVHDLLVPSDLLSLEILGTFFLTLAATAVLVAIIIYDIRHKIIPDPFVFIFIGISLIALGFSGLFRPVNTEFILDIMAGPLLFLPFFLLWYMSGGRWIGLGDGKLALGIGFFLGFVGGISAVVLSFWIGAAFALSVMALDKLSSHLGRRARTFFSEHGLTMKSEIPFAPFMIAGTFAYLFFEWDVFNLSLVLQGVL